MPITKITLKFIDLVQFQTAQIMYKAINNLLPGNLRFNRDEDYNLRGEYNLKPLRVRTTLKKENCISICGLKL